ncbi:hypothetical protein O3P69_012947 [Scylla paramamosain]|uniref:Ig-like domain-containing protein n=1 Tax=Scylla paramamosain TaxID=85552 RepID=A0AAW0TQN4_SCYPA
MQMCVVLALTCLSVPVHAQPAAGVLESDSQWWQGWHEMPGPAVTREQVNVTAVAGQTASLPCRVMNLGDRTVSWIRTQDSAVLAVDRTTITSDPRFSVNHPEETED